MTISLGKPFTLDRVHLDYLYIDIEKTDAAKTSIRAKMRLYSQDANGMKTFGNESWDVNVEDVQALVIEMASKNDMRGVAANGYVESLVALLVDVATPLGTASVA